MGLIEAEDIKKWKEYTELYKKDLKDPDNHDGMITHLEPDILECKVQWALGSITTKSVDGIPAELGASLMAQSIKCLPAMQETRVRSLGGEDPLEEGMATHSSILVWRIP